MRDGTELYYDVIQWGGKCVIGDTWYEVELESVLLEIDEIYGYIKQEMDKFDITKKMNVHLTNAVTELDNGKVLMHFHGTVRYRSTWEFEEISFTLLCDTKEKRVIPYR